MDSISIRGVSDIKMWYIELIGIIASLFVTISFIFTGLRKIRIINTIGSIIFVIYAILIGSISVGITNGVAIIINLYYLFKDKKEV